MVEFNGIHGFGGAMPPREDPETVLRNYMAANNCSEAEAKAALEKQFGRPPQQAPGMTPQGSIDFSYRASTPITTTQTNSVSSDNQNQNTTTKGDKSYGLPASNEKYQKIEEKIEAKLNKKGKINPTKSYLFDNSRSIVKKWIKAYMKENNVTQAEAEDAFCLRFDCTLKVDDKNKNEYAFYRN